jgi:hypothetical protein
MSLRNSDSESEFNGPKIVLGRPLHSAFRILHFALFMADFIAGKSLAPASRPVVYW